MSSHAQAASSSNAGPAARRRSHGQRRLVPEGEGESSREASAESNEETPSGPDLDDDDLMNDNDDDAHHALGLPRPSAEASAAIRSLHAPLEGMRLGSSASPPTTTTTVGAAGSLGTPKAAPPGSLAGVAHHHSQSPLQPPLGGEGYDSAGHDGDISSATAASHHPASAARLASHPHAFRAPIGLGPSGVDSGLTSRPAHPSAPQASYLSSASSSLGGDEAGTSSPSPPATATETEEVENDTEADTGAEADDETTTAADAVESRHPGVGPRSAAGGAGGEGQKDGDVMWAPAPSGFLSNLTAAEIQEHIRTAIAGDPRRPYKINPPPEGRPVRIYADGVYDLLHYGHMLQLRQCKLMFPSVHLLVGVCSSSLVRAHKSHPVLSSHERYESVRHVRWVDEVVENAPWQVDQDFIDKWQIDYVAHDEEPYASAGKDDVYAYVKSIGAFLPTKRTNGVSTSELLQRIVEGYRDGEYDGKLRKIGHPELCSRQGSEVGTQHGGS